MTGYWGLRYSGTDVQFTDDSGIYLREYPTIGDYDITNDDTGIPRDDGTQFGEDFHGGRTVGLTFGLSGSTLADLAQRQADIVRYWGGDSIRRSPGAMAELVSEGGRSAFGRPRKIAPSDASPEALLMTYEADFVTADKLWYGDEHSSQVSLVPGDSGGFAFPLEFPLTTSDRADATVSFTVAGDVATWPIVELYGPVTTGLGFEVLGQFAFAFDLQLVDDSAPVVIDTRPWVRSITQAGASVAGHVRSTSSRLMDASLPPGIYTLVMRGASALGNPRAVIRWRDAHTGP
ncbi:hypothetical protein [Curtobacterium sp. MCBD17_003]|uniref:hypothetical protein n=1 Tax=Curtobacterium sp. MCBD17_003 TaxID=2175667 RepID=UPI000DA825C3|nr:hypothetical protein [Curtobacterium sp. MCBD17_003]WIE54232.1 hypothetical protein DEI88_014075 [Curtobacterium sp. MCBD17_003]